MNFNFRDSHSSSLFKFNHILKLEDKILIFKSWFIFCSDVHNYQTVSSTADNIFKPSNRTNSYGEKSVTVAAINSWNETQHQFSNLHAVP